MQLLMACGWMSNELEDVNVMKHLQVQVGIENILDRNYRHLLLDFLTVARSFLVALRANW